MRETARAPVHLCFPRHPNMGDVRDILAGATAAEQADMKLGGGAKDFYYLAHHTACTTIAHKDDAADHREMMASFGVLGFAPDEQRSVLRVCAAVLHLGNLRFDGDEKDEYTSLERLRNVSADLVIGHP